MVFASTSRNKKICFASLRATQKFGEHEQASTRLNFASKSSKIKFREQLKILMGHSSPLVCTSKAVEVSFQCSLYITGDFSQITAGHRIQ